MSIYSVNLSANRAKSILEQQQGSTTLAFEEALPAEMLDKHTAGLPGRNRIFTPHLILRTFLSQVISVDQSCQAAVVSLLAKLAVAGSNISANTAAYCKARARFPKEIASGLTRELAEKIEEKVPDAWLWRGRPVRLVDGSCLSMPDTPENQAVYPQPDTQKKALDSPWLALWPWYPWQRALSKILLWVHTQGKAAVSMDCYAN